MKTAWRAAALLLVLGTSVVMARADAGSSSASDDADNPAAVDPDGVPRAFLPSHPAPRASDASVKAAQEKAEQDQDWLLRGYEQQMQARALAQRQGGNDNNLYAKIAGDKDLAKMAGLTDANLTSAPPPENLLTSPGGHQPTLSLRPDSTISDSKPATTKPFSTMISALAPLATPLSASEAAGFHDFYRSLPGFSSTTPVTPAPDSDLRLNSDPAALDIPGMTAAESDPTKRSEMDLSLDLLPGESPADHKADSNLTLDLPAATNAGRLQKQQDTAMDLPGKHRTVAPVPISPLLLKPISDTAEMVPDPAPIRGQVGDPYDILR
jgi:hypothetical protein